MSLIDAFNWLPFCYLPAPGRHDIFQIYRNQKLSVDLKFPDIPKVIGGKEITQMLIHC